MHFFEGCKRLQLPNESWRQGRWAEDYFISRQHSVGVKMKVHMWAARRPLSFHRGKLTWLTLPLWNTVNSYSVSNVLHCRKSKSSIMSLEFYTTPKEASVTQMLISPIDSGPVLDTTFPCSSAVCCVGLLSLSSHLLCCHTEHCGDATALSNPKTIEESVLVHWIWFHQFDGYGCSVGGLSLPRELLHGHLCFLSAGGLGWHHGALGC